MAYFIQDVTAEGKKFLEQLEELASMEVCVGFQAGEKSYEDGADVIDVAVYNEFGTSTIPARPFMKQSFENHQGELKKICESVVAEVSNGGKTQQALQKLGTYLRGLVQEEIVNGDFVPNSPVTIALKGSSQPLIDTGLMRQSVNFIVRKAK